MEELKEFPDFLNRAESASLLRVLFDRRHFWEAREERKVNYRNGDWYTLGTSLYLDLKSEKQFPEYVNKTAYWKRIMREPFFRGPLDIFRKKLSAQVFRGIKDVDVQFLADVPGLPVGYPGFHIFPGFENLVAFFGRKHKDLQWEQLFKIPQVQGFFEGKEVGSHFSLTLPLLLPFLGGGLLRGEKLDNFTEYKQGSLYLHSGQEDHAIAPFSSPVLPCDWRITLQCHGFVVGNIVYLYW